MKFLVKIQDSDSQEFFARFGVPQGPKLSPKSFNIFINEVPHHFHTHLATFSDNTWVFNANKNRYFSNLAITRLLRLLSTWFSEWRVAIDVNKTESVLSSLLNQESKDKYKIALNNTYLLWWDNCKYLRIILDKVLPLNNILYYLYA